MKAEQKIKAIADGYISKIRGGEYGESGDMFFTTRALAAQNDISLEYASRVMGRIADEKVITLIGKHYYVTTGQVKLHSSMHGKLKTRSSFGMIVSNLQNAFVSGLANAVSEVTEKHGYSLIIRVSDNIQSVLNDFLLLGVKGVFVDPFTAKINPDALRYYPLPVVSLSSDITSIGRDSIVVDNYLAGRAVADHLLETGCEVFAYFGFERSGRRDDRFEGYREGLKEKGIPLGEESVFMLTKDAKGKYDAKVLRGLVHKLVWETPSYKKVGAFCYHDLLAYDVISIVENGAALYESRRIPDNFSVVGFDDLTISSRIKPSLTTVSYPLIEMASKGIDMMFQCLTDEGHIPSRQTVLFSLVKRDTTAMSRQTLM